MNENESTTTQNLWDSVKAVLKGRFIAILVTSKNKRKINKLPNFTSKATRKIRNEEPQG